MNKETKEAIKKGLEYYNIFKSDNEFIRKSGSIVYKILWKDNHEYSFHLYEDQNQEDITNSIESPLLLIEELRRTTDLSLPKPLKNINNKLVTPFEMNNNKYVCTLQHWLNGEILKYRNEIHAKKIGYIIAKIHSYSINHENVKSFKLISSSRNWRVDEPLDRLNIELKDGKITKENYDILTTAATKAYDKISANSKKKDFWGVVHGDLNPTNFLIHNEIISILDFTSYYEFYVYDLALAMWRKFYQPSMTPKERIELISEYKRIRELSDDFNSLLEAAIISLVIWRYSLYKGLKQKENDLSLLLPKFVRNECKKFLSGKSFLYDDWTEGF